VERAQARAARLRRQAESIMVHFIPPGGTTAGGPKIACADLG
jgi:hypothetical protein